MDAINRLVEHYKLISEGFNRSFYFLPRITTAMIMHFRLLVNHEGSGGEREDFFEMNGAVSGQIQTGDEARLKEILRSPKTPDLIEALDLQIRGCLDLHDWRQAIIESAILFESWLQPVIRNHFRQLLGSNTKLDKKLSFFDTDGKSHPMPIGDILRLLVEEAFGFPFQESKEYTDLLAHTIKPRNNLVHGKPFMATKQNAEDAYASCRAAIASIKPHIPAQTAL